MATTLVVLSDGETYSSADGACILVVNDEAKYALETGAIDNPKDIPDEWVIAEIPITDIQNRER